MKIDKEFFEEQEQKAVERIINRASNGDYEGAMIAAKDAEEAWHRKQIAARQGGE